MVSIWMLGALRTPGSELHKALQACPRPHAPPGRPARPRRQTLGAVRPSRAPKSLRLGRLSCRRRTQSPGGVDRSLRIAKKGACRAKPRGLTSSAQLNPL